MAEDFLGLIGSVLKAKTQVGSAMPRFCSIFSQLLPLLEFQQVVSHRHAERQAWDFTNWEQFIAMLFRQLGRAHTLRKFCSGLAACEDKLKPLGIIRACSWPMEVVSQSLPRLFSRKAAASHFG